MRIHVLGVGAIGSLFSFHLRKSLPRDIPISLIIRHHDSGVTRRPHPDARQGITVEREGKTETVKGFDPEVFRLTNDMIFGLAYGGNEYGKLGKRTVQRPSGSNEEKDLDDEEYRPQRHQDRFQHRPLTGNPHSIDSLIVTTKAGATLPGIQRILPRLHRNSTIVLLQNGLGVYDSLVETLFTDPEKRPHFVLATTTHGVWAKGPMNVTHAGMGDFHFGIVPDPMGRRNYEASLDRTGALDLSDISQDPNNEPEFSTLYETVQALSSLQELNPEWESMPHLQIRLMKKLTVNACVNPLTALMDVTNGELLGLAPAYRIIKSICHEASGAFTAQAQAELSSLQPGEQPSMLGTSASEAIYVANQLTSSKLEEETTRVIGLTAKNYSSMLQDIKKGRATEIDYMNGYLVELGKKYYMPMNVNSTMVQLIKTRHELGWATELPGVARWWEPLGSWRKPLVKRKQTVLSQSRPDGRRGSPL